MSKLLIKDLKLKNQFLLETWACNYKNANFLSFQRCPLTPLLFQTRNKQTFERHYHDSKSGKINNNLTFREFSNVSIKIVNIINRIPILDFHFCDFNWKRFTLLAELSNMWSFKLLIVIGIEGFGLIWFKKFCGLWIKVRDRHPTNFRCEY